MALLSTPSSIVAHRFLIEEMAGSGGMGSVYRARDLLTGQPVALKVLHMASPSAQDAERFAREARLLATLEHPGIVRYVAHGQTAEGQSFLAMEWLTGHDLLMHMQKQPLTVDESLLLMLHVAEALVVAHRRGIVHRDLKPSNLFLRDGDIARVTLLDFGIARDGALGGGRALTRTGALMGTPGYMAPEQARGQAQLTASADIFSLGCLFYECLTGRPPFVGEHLEAILVKILFEPEKPLRALRPELPASLELLLSRMLAKDPSARLPHAMALLEAMSGLETGSSSGDGPVRSSTTAEALTTSEQQLVSVLIARSDDAQADETTLNPVEVEEAEKQLLAVRETLSAMNVRNELLSDGTLVAALISTRGEAATDQAQRAALCALLVRERCPDSVLALATGRGVLEGPLPIGEAVNSAVKLAHLHPLKKTTDGSLAPVILDKATAELLGPRFRVEPIDAESVALRSIDGSADEARRLLGRPTPCVGRESELGQLEALLNACIEESSPRALLVLSPPGIGKSRLRHEFLRRVASRGDDIQVMIGRGDLLAGNTPFFALREAVLGLCEIQRGDAVAVRREKLLRRISRVVPERDRPRVVAFIGELCGVHFDDTQNAELREARQQPRRMEDSIRQAFCDFLSAECAEHPVILVLEDLHFSDNSTVIAIDAALRELSERPLYVMALGRPEVSEQFPRLWHDRVQLMPLRPLSRKASEMLVRQVLGLKTPPETTARLVERAAGNALYLEELIRAYSEKSEHAELPHAVLAMLQTRIGRLEAGARRALRAASIFGESCWSGGVATLLGMAKSECERWLIYLLREELLEQRPESRFPDETEYRFRHALLRDAAYSMLSDADRVLGHKLAARFLETRMEAPRVLAHHFQEAGEHDKAITYFLLAGDETMRLGLFTEGRLAYAAAEALFARLPSTPEHRSTQVDTLCKQVAAGLTSDSVAVQLERLDKARTLHGSDGRSPDDVPRMLRIEFLSGSVCHFGGRPGDAIRYFRKVQPIAEQIGDAEMALSAAMSIGAGLCIEGRFGMSRDRLAWVLPLLEQLGNKNEWRRGHSYFVMALSASGRVVEALDLAERGHVLISGDDQLLGAASYRVMRATAHMLSANWPELLVEAQKLLEMAGKLGDKLFFYAGWDLSAWAESHLGQHEKALAHRAQARELRRAMGGGVMVDWFDAAEAELLLLAGRPSDALEHLRGVLLNSRPTGLLFSQAIAERLWGEVLHRLGGSLDDVEAHFRTALAICKEGDQVVNSALTEMAWAQVLRERGDTSASQLHLGTAITTLDRAGCHHALKLARGMR